jgi:hypothetical protein
MSGMIDWTHMGSIRVGGLAGGRPGGGRRRGNRGASATARFPAKCGAELGHGWLWELEWGLRKELKCLGGEQAEGEVHRSGVNGDGGGQLCSRARAREEQGGL